MSMVQRRLGDPPESCGTGVSEQQHRATRGRGRGGGILVRPPWLLGIQTGAAASWHGCNHTPLQPPALRLTHRLVSLPTRRTGKGGNGLLTLLLEITPPPPAELTTSRFPHEHQRILLRLCGCVRGQDAAGRSRSALWGRLSWGQPQMGGAFHISSFLQLLPQPLSLIGRWMMH